MLRADVGATEAPPLALSLQYWDAEALPRRSTPMASSQDGPSDAPQLSCWASNATGCGPHFSVNPRFAAARHPAG
jgi:hypothetical protein